MSGFQTRVILFHKSIIHSLETHSLETQIKISQVIAGLWLLLVLGSCCNILTLFYSGFLTVVSDRMLKNGASFLFLFCMNNISICLKSYRDFFWSLQRLFFLVAVGCSACIVSEIW